MMKDYYLSLISDGSKDPLSRSLRAALYLASHGYAAGVSIKRRAMKLAAKRLPLPVVSVGNLTWGGTGKTPFVMYLMEKITAMDKKPLLITRGYGDDETREFSSRFPEIPVALGADRYRTAIEALGKHAADIAVCDDAFQHWKLVRDWDIVLINSASPFGNGYLIPRGELRETPFSLERAHTIVFTNCDRVPADHMESLKKRVREFAPHVEFAESVHEPFAFHNPASLRTEDFSGWRERQVVEVSGIGSPDLFSDTLRRTGVKIAKRFDFPDHHRFTESDLAEIRHFAAQHKAPVVTTEKDFHRNPDLWMRLIDPWLLKIRLKVVSGEDKIQRKLEFLLSHKMEAAHA